MTTQILLAEDNAIDAELISEAFKDGCLGQANLQTVSDGEKALRVIRSLSRKPRLVVLDLNLPKMSGLEVLREIRQDPDPAINTLTVLILTNSRSPLDVTQAYTAGCNAFIQKPLGYEGILALVKKTGAFWLGTATLPGQEATLPPPSSGN